MQKFLAPTIVVAGLLTAGIACPAQKYDLVLRHGHVIDPKNHIDGPDDVAVLDGKIALVASSIAPEEAVRAVDASGLYVTPGLIDIHTHVYAGTGERDS